MRNYQYNYGISLKCFIDQILTILASIKVCFVWYGGKPKFTFNVKKNTFKISCKGVDGSKVIYKTKKLKKQHESFYYKL